MSHHPSRVLSLFATTLLSITSVTATPALLPRCPYKPSTGTAPYSNKNRHLPNLHILSHLPPHHQLHHIHLLPTTHNINNHTSHRHLVHHPLNGHTHDFQSPNQDNTRLPQLRSLYRRLRHLTPRRSQQQQRASPRLHILRCRRLDIHAQPR